VIPPDGAAFPLLRLELRALLLEIAHEPGELGFVLLRLELAKESAEQ
jgi:hypothetical protein